MARWGLLMLTCCAMCAPLAMAQATREVEITYACTVEAIPTGARTVDLWLPVPTPTDGLRVGTVTVTRPEGGALETEPRYGNRMYHRRWEAPFDAAAIGAELRVALARTAIVDAASAPTTQVSIPEPALQVYREANHLVPIDGEVAVIAGKLGLADLVPMAAARRVYDFLIDEMTYSWLAPGAGVGDVPRMCDSRKGDCTDYHSLFLALCRNRGIPADHEFGFPIRTAAESGKIASYHCWARFYVEGSGWIPIDASEADKHPELRAHNFGSQDVDVFRFSHGRDLTLMPPQQGPPLNYFIEPYVEVDGAPHQAEKHTVSFKNLPAGSVQ